MTERAGGSEVAPGVHRFTDAFANWYAVQGANGLLLIDSGWPRGREALVRGLARIGSQPGDVRAVLLTHGHADHLGTAAWLSASYGTPVYAGAAELPRVRGELPPTRGPSLRRYLWRPTALRFIALAIGRGILSPQWVGDVRSVQDAGLESVVPVACPGHTEGHTAYLTSGVLFTGDALVTRDVLTGATGPRLHPAPFQVDIEQAARSLDALAAVPAQLILPGHGEPFHGSPEVAVSLARP